jgi:hypothetical protein
MTPKNMPKANQSSSKFVFQDNVTTKEDAFNSVKSAIAYVFDQMAKNGKGYVDQGRVVMTMFVAPEVQIMGSLHIKMGIGYVQGRSSLGPTSTLTLILDRNCRDVVTAYPGNPYNRRR